MATKTNARLTTQKTTDLTLSLIVRDSEIQPRERINHDTVTQYAEDMLAGITFPPAVVYHDGDRYWLSQGFHRSLAAEEAGSETLLVEVRKGSREDALWDAAGSNREHDASGMRRTNADKRRAVEMALKARPKLSARAIAEQVGVGNKLVSDMKRATCVPNTPDRVTGSDGKSYPATNGTGHSEAAPTEDTEDDDDDEEEPTPDADPTPPEEPFTLISEPVIAEVKPATRATFNATNEMVDWARWTWNPVTGCDHNCVYCLTPETLVTLYDGSTREIGDLSVGDKLLGFTEASRELRIIERSVVEAVVWNRRPIWKILTSHGVIKTTAEHRWLTATSNLGDYIAREGHRRGYCVDTGRLNEAARWHQTKNLFSGKHLLWFDAQSIPHSDLLIEGNFFAGLPIPILDVEETQEVSDVVDIQTSSRTFLAEGFATHNCYARDIANRFYPEKFTPTFRPERLEAPRNTGKPTEAKYEEDPVKAMSWRNVFVCSMADLFGGWVPKQWIEDVFASCRKSPQWNYLFLTKFPQRYVGLDFPETSWVGTSVDEQKRVASAEKAFAKIKVPVKWLSVEPMREQIVFSDLSMFDWVVIGGQSRSSGAPEFHPEPWWVIDLAWKAREAGCKVYLKPNTFVNSGWQVKEYPY